MRFWELFWGMLKTTIRVGSTPWRGIRQPFPQQIGQIYAELGGGGKSEEISPQTALLYSDFWNRSSHNTTATLFVPFRDLHYASRPPTLKDLLLGDPEHTENRALSRTGA